MTLSLKHKFTSAIPDAGDPTIVQPSNWNDEHAMTQATSTILGRVSALTGPTEELTPAQARTLLNVADGATANSTDAFLLARANHTGTESADVLTDGTTNKAFLATERTKLAGIATGATANQTDAFLLARANHTGTQSADTLTDGTTNKAFLATERTKLAGIATGADVTATALNTTAKGTPVDADRIYGGDSAASFGTVYATWTQAKAFLKTYFDTLYQPLAAALTSWAGVTRASGFDTFAATPSSANLKALLTDETGTGAAVFANTPTLVTPNIGAATGLSLSDQTSITGSYSATARYPVNSFVVAADDLDMGLDGGKVDGLFVNHLYGGAAARGGRHALETISVLTAATASDNPDRNYVGAAFTGWAIASDGGGLGTEKGGIFGLNAQGVLATGATNFLNVTAAEFDVAVNTGASVQYKSGIQVCARPDDAVQGYLYDTMVGLSNAAGAVGWNYGILMGPMNSAHPMKTTGTIFATTGSATVANGIDFSSYTITGNFLKGPGPTTLTGDGALLAMAKDTAGIRLGSPSVAGTPFVDFLSSGLVSDYDVRVIAGGGTATHGTGTLTIVGGLSVTAFIQGTQVRASGTGGIGYATGAGGTVTQGTSRTTGVTLNKTSGAITMFSAAGSATAATFTVTNSLVAATDTISLSQKSGTNLYNFIVTAVAAGSFNITFYTTGGTATDAPVINFNVIKGVTA